MTGKDRFAKIILAVKRYLLKGYANNQVKKDEKSVENLLTELLIFGTMIKHLVKGFKESTFEKLDFEKS